MFFDKQACTQFYLANCWQIPDLSLSINYVTCNHIWLYPSGQLYKVIAAITMHVHNITIHVIGLHAACNRPACCMQAYYMYSYIMHVHNISIHVIGLHAACRPITCIVILCMCII